MPIGHENHQFAHISVQTYARIAGVLLLLTIPAGSFGEFYVPSRLIVSTDATTRSKDQVSTGKSRPVCSRGNRAATRARRWLEPGWPQG